jgi:hypothetical protein
MEAGHCELIKNVSRSCAIGILEDISKQPVGDWRVGPGLEDCQERASDVEDKLKESCKAFPGFERF